MSPNLVFTINVGDGGFCFFLSNICCLYDRMTGLESGQETILTPGSKNLFHVYIYIYINNALFLILGKKTAVHGPGFVNYRNQVQCSTKTKRSLSTLIFVVVHLGGR